MKHPIDLSNKRVIISRTDSIGDVMLTLPICDWLKSNFANVTIIFLGKTYTRPIVSHYQKVDRFEDWNDYEKQSLEERIKRIESLNADAIIHVFPNKEIARLAKKSGIEFRIGTSHRLFHYSTCNVKLNFTRKRSELHESQLNFELLRPFGLKEIPSIDQVIASTQYMKVPDVAVPEEFQSLEQVTILHPKSQGSALEWPMEKYMQLAETLTAKGKTVVFTGTENEGLLFRDKLPSNDKIIDTTGKLSLEQLMKLIAKADNLVACSTGPLHIAGYYGVNTIGLFSSRRPIHPGRWRALGPKVHALVHDEDCAKCAKKQECDCIIHISVDDVVAKIV